LNWRNIHKLNTSSSLAFSQFLSTISGWIYIRFYRICPEILLSNFEASERRKVAALSELWKENSVRKNTCKPPLFP
jgi:hypothetical protein